MGLVLLLGLSVKIDRNLWQRCHLNQCSSCSLPNYRQGKKNQIPLNWRIISPFLDKPYSCSFIKPESKTRGYSYSFCSVQFPIFFPKHSVMLRILHWLRRWNSSLQAKRSEEFVSCPQYCSKLGIPPTTSLQLFSYSNDFRSMSLELQLPEMQPVHFNLNLLIELSV